MNNSPKNELYFSRSSVSSKLCTPKFNLRDANFSSLPPVQGAVSIPSSNRSAFNSKGILKSKMSIKEEDDHQINIVD
jgi:hypothetical protein